MQILLCWRRRLAARSSSASRRQLASARRVPVTPLIARRHCRLPAACWRLPTAYCRPATPFALSRGAAAARKTNDSLQFASFIFTAARAPSVWRRRQNAGASCQPVRFGRQRRLKVKEAEGERAQGGGGGGGAEQAGQAKQRQPNEQQPFGEIEAARRVGTTRLE